MGLQDNFLDSKLFEIWTVFHVFNALRTVVENSEDMLDNEATGHDDLFDAFRMSMQFWS
jgi:hypothetical protein